MPQTSGQPKMLQTTTDLFLSSLLLLFFFQISFALNELISVRCQAKCLADFELTSLEKGSIQRRLLKHSIISLCSQDKTCSSCGKPCRQELTELSLCYSVTCLGSAIPLVCHESCRFIQNSSFKKPGKCPLLLQEPDEACYSTCSNDSQCAAIERCCTRGCSNVCVNPVSINDLVSIPQNLTVTERKRGRSAVLRWNIEDNENKKLKYSTLFAVQWKWGVKRDDNAMTPWKTITIKNKNMAILKHILSAGRYYKFRISAVDSKGSRGFSESTDYFILRRKPKAPGKPMNIETSTVHFDNQYLTNRVTWLPPKSDLPIIHYQITWSKSVEPMRMSNDGPVLNTTDQLMKIINNDLINEIRSTLVSSDQLSINIDQLLPDTNYLIEVHAIAENESGQIEGERNYISIKTIDVQSAIGLTIGPSYHLEDSVTEITLPIDEQIRVLPKVENVKIENSFFHNGLLKANVKWSFLFDKSIFKLSWWPFECNQHSSAHYSSSNPLTYTTKSIEFELFDLEFSCNYYLNISAKLTSGHLWSLPVQNKFATTTCQLSPVFGNVAPPCLQKLDDDYAQNVTCSNLDISTICTWDAPKTNHYFINGYRIIFGKRLLNENGPLRLVSDPTSLIEPKKVSAEILSKYDRRFVMTKLIPDQEYVFCTQASFNISFGKPKCILFIHTRPIESTTTGTISSPSTSIFLNVVQEIPKSKPKEIPALSNNFNYSSCGSHICFRTIFILFSLWYDVRWIFWL